MPSLKNLEKPTSKKIAHGKMVTPSKSQKKVKAALKLKNEEAKQKDLKKGKVKVAAKKVVASKVKDLKTPKSKAKESKVKEVEVEMESMQIELPLEMPETDEAPQANTFHASHEDPSETSDAHPLATENDVTPKVSFQFYGSEALREKLPQAFEFAEQVATDWVQDGEFEGLPFKNPLAQFFVAKSLRKAKDTEKQILEKIETHPVLSKAKTGLVEKAQLASATLKLLLKK